MTEPMEAGVAPDTIDMVVLCGGRGTRLGSLTSATPKPLLSIGGQPFLLRLLRHLQDQGVRRFILAAQYLSDRLLNFAGEISHQVSGVEVVVEPEPLGTGGGLRHAVEHVRSKTFMALNGDSWLPQPLAPVLAQHIRTGADMTLVAVPASHVEGRARSKGICRLSADDRLLGFDTVDEATDGWVNAGLYVLERRLVATWPHACYSLEAELMRLTAGSMVRIARSSARLLDIGTPGCLQHAERYWTSDPSPIHSEV